MKQICAGILIGIVILLTLSACSNIDSSFSQVVSEQNSTQGDNTMQEYTSSLERQQNFCKRNRAYCCLRKQRYHQSIGGTNAHDAFHA